jgi:DNA polymerase (family 10)
VTTGQALSGTLRQLGDLADIRGAAIEAADLRRAAGTIDALDQKSAARLIQLARRDRLSEIPELSPAVHWKLREVALGGAVETLSAARAGIPVLLKRLLELPAITTAQAVALVRAGIVTRNDLAVALQAGRIDHQFSHDVVRSLRVAVEALALESRPLTLGRAWDVLDVFLDTLAAAVPQIEEILPAGDVRRFEPLVESLVIVARCGDPAAAVEAIGAVPAIDDVLHRTSRRAVVLYSRTEIDVHVPSRDDFGAVLHATTGSRAHLAALAARRPRAGLRAREEDVYAHAGLPYIAPELRHATGEIQAAASNTLPVLVTRADIRGDLHMHTTYSDGRDSLETMVETAAALGYEYIAITDHSERAGASRTVTRATLARQRDEILRLRGRFPDLVILHGIEVDIMPDGRLDFGDDILAGLDIVIASLHDSARQDGRTLTRRALEAVRHPLVNILSHPANRLVGRHPGYDLDFEAIYLAAAETGTALEIDGAPGHLDLDGDRARAAAAAGALLTIDSDCHRASALDRQMRFGVGTARRGWVEARHVLNTRRIDEVRAFVGAKRARSR